MQYNLKRQYGERLLEYSNVNQLNIRKMNFKEEILNLLKSVGQPYLRLRIRKSRYGKTAFIYFGQSYLTIAIDEDNFGVDVPIDDLKIFIRQSSEVMIWLLENRYGQNWNKYVKVIYPNSEQKIIHINQ